MSISSQTDWSPPDNLNVALSAAFNLIYNTLETQPDYTVEAAADASSLLHSQLVPAKNLLTKIGEAVVLRKNLDWKIIISSPGQKKKNNPGSVVLFREGLNPLHHLLQCSCSVGSRRQTNCTAKQSSRVRIHDAAVWMRIREPQCSGPG